ncbi:hypothetical protein E2C01_074788 [Portunus trituberculatus]|uniref:Uncharacterized protein n=1 Tax=Portunus trituberculatus TaxID=210409 RepID=A0A5B7IE26_PORTR|nr:hypothetical protein [Portunus trituberculatus]
MNAIPPPAQRLSLRTCSSPHAKQKDAASRSGRLMCHLKSSLSNIYGVWSRRRALGHN